MKKSLPTAWPHGNNQETVRSLIKRLSQDLSQLVKRRVCIEQRHRQSLHWGPAVSEAIDTPRGWDIVSQIKTSGHLCSVFISEEVADVPASAQLSLRQEKFIQPGVELPLLLVLAEGICMLLLVLRPWPPYYLILSSVTAHRRYTSTTALRH